MTNPELHEYIRQHRANGESPEAIRTDLTKAGWNEADIQAGLSAIPETHPAPMTVHSGKRWPLIAAVAGILLLVSAGGAFAYLRYFRPTPDRVLAKALSQTVRAKSSEYALSMRVEVTPDGKNPETSTLLPLAGLEDGKPIKILLTLEGALDISDPADSKSKNVVTVASTETMGGVPLGLEIRRAEKITYISLSRAPKTPIMDLSPFVGQWVKFDPQSLLQQFAISATATPMQTDRPTSEQLDQAEAAFLEVRPVSVSKVLQDEAVDGVASHHYRLAVDKEKLKTFLLRLQTIKNDKASLAYEKLGDDFDEYSKYFTFEAPEIWIGKKSGLPTRFLSHVTMKESADVPATGSATLDVAFKSFNQPVLIEAPAEAKSFEEVLSSFIPSTAFNQQEPSLNGSADTERLSNVRHIQTALELGFSEMNAYPIAPHPILLGYGATRVLCASKGKSAWVDETNKCDGSIFLSPITPDPDLQRGGYTYRSMDGRSYVLQFTLASDIGTLKAGPQCASQNGINSTTCIPSDKDGDGLSEAEEIKYHSDPADADSDDDGYTDSAEVAGGYNPNGPGPLK